MIKFVCRTLLLSVVVAGAFGLTPARAAEECVAAGAAKCPAGWQYREGTQCTELPNPMGQPIRICDNKCCRQIVDCPPNKYGTPGCPYPPLAKGWAGANIDMPGGDYQNFDLNGEYPSDCRDACSRNTMCKAWTYVRPGVQGPKARCWLKSSVPPARSNNCCISEVIERGDLKVH